MTLRWSYGRVMTRTLEEGDLLPSRQTSDGWGLPLPDGLRRAVVV